jgi:hypothetical protein
MLQERNIDTSHFRNARLEIPEHALHAAVREATSYADVMRALKLDVNDTNHRRIRRRVAELGLDTSHFTRRPWGSVQTSRPKPMREKVLVVLPTGSARPNRARLHAALQDSGIPYQCATCGNPGQWLGQPITLQIDHINGDWLDNRIENLRYLCPNRHALTATWCRQKAGRHTEHPASPVH